MPSSSQEGIRGSDSSSSDNRRRQAPGSSRDCVTPSRITARAVPNTAPPAFLHQNVGRMITRSGPGDGHGSSQQSGIGEPRTPVNVLNLLRSVEAERQAQLMSRPLVPLASPSGSHIDRGALITPPRSQSSSQTSRGSSSSSGRRPPLTPTSNFDIREPEFSSSDDSNGDGSDEDSNIFPPGANVLERSRRSWRESLNSSPESLPLGISATQEEILGENGSVHSAEIRRRRQLLEGRPDNDSKDVVMCVLWAGQRFAASYYDLETGQLFMLPDISDAPPDFDVLRSAYNQIRPTYVLVNKSSEQRFLQVVHELTGHEFLSEGSGDDYEVREDENRSNNDVVHLYPLPSRDFAPDSCKQRVNSLKLPFEPKNNSQQEHLLFVTSLIPFSNENMIRCMGCLLRFLDRSAIEIFQIDMTGGQVPVVDVKLFKMDDIVLVDETAWRSLQIFSTDIHPSSYKQGKSSGSKEGLSVYSLLNECVTTQGEKKLRLMLLRPSRSRELLSRRYDVIEYCMSTNHMEFVKSATEALKFVKSVPKLLYRLSLLHATVNEWKDMYNTMYHCLLLGEICASQETAPSAIREIGFPDFMAILRGLTQEMMSVIDFEQSMSTHRIVAREGVDEELDKKKRQFACLPDIMSIVASEEMSELPAYVTQCCVVYIPEVGYLLAITIWKENLSDQELHIENLDYRFRTQELAYYKSPRMRELDVILGDCSVFILEKETLIMVRLSNSILSNAAVLHKVNDLVSDLDSLLAMSRLSREYEFTRPPLLPGEGRMKIIDGWHPLSDLICEFVRNSTVFRASERVIIITGPNASGKSVLLKQVGVIVLMALSGCFVPAAQAQIPLFDKICTRIHAQESIATGFSTFMIDVNQMSLAIRSSCNKSLIIIDEFGKGTSEIDGLAILTASIQDFIDREDDCPTIFLSTHFYSMMKYLRPSPLLKYQTMKVMDINGSMTYLFELIDGKCEKSFACVMAKSMGIPSDTVERASQIERVITGESREAIEQTKTEQHCELDRLMTAMGREFLSINVDEVEPIEYLQNSSCIRAYNACKKQLEENSATTTP